MMLEIDCLKMKSDQELQTDVQGIIKREPLLDAAEIGFIAKEGVATLTGMLGCCAKKSGSREC
ncbi:MAG: hypothetical protein NTW54_03785 [Bacteroidetes bacterium]|nr:hypothetical protein [Bacteroidota bacterium]